MNLDNSCRIDALRSEQAEAVQQLMERVVRGCSYYNDWAVRSEIERYSAAKLREMTSHDPESVLVAESQGGPVGFCLSHNDSMGLIWLAWMGVAEDWRRRGLAEALVRRLLAGARRRGAHKVWCDTRAANTASAALLEKLGFGRLCEVKNHWYGLDYHLWQREV